tara:strand:+ start:248 stop:526 length:279 start_codon:yes stop_codon:yes gene_type:complete
VEGWVVTTGAVVSSEVSSWAEVASGADVAVRVMDEVIWLPSSWGQVLTFGGLNRGLFDSLEGKTFDGSDSNKSNELEHFYKFIIKTNFLIND